jgi:hypothetical protein
MVKKTFIALVAILISFNLYANEEMSENEKCETAYSACLEKCDTTSTEQDKEVCYDKCDVVYSSCLEKIKSE